MMMINFILRVRNILLFRKGLCPADKLNPKAFTRPLLQIKAIESV